MKKRTQTFVMAMLVVLSLAACNGNSGSGSSNETTPPYASQSDASKEVAESEAPAESQIPEPELSDTASTSIPVSTVEQPSAAKPALPNVQDESTEQNAGLPSAPAQTETPTEEPVLSQPSEPTEVLKIYENYEQAIENNKFNFILGPIKKSTMDTSEFYSFYLKYDSAYPNTFPEATFQKYEGVTHKSYHVSLPENCDNLILKDAILCTIIAADPNIEYSDAETYMEELVNSFDGHNRSDIVSLGDSYKLYIRRSSAGILSSTYLEIVSADEVNDKVDISEYKDYTSQEMHAPLNKGEKVHLTGIVQANYDLEYSNILEVAINEERYIVYYNFENFLDSFSIGQEYDFYGTIAEAKDGYSGCLSLVYYEEKN